MVVVTNELSIPKFQTNGIFQKMQNMRNVRCQSEKISSTVQSFGRRVRPQRPHFDLSGHDKVAHNVRVQVSRAHDALLGRQQIDPSVSHAETMNLPAIVTVDGRDGRIGNPTGAFGNVRTIQYCSSSNGNQVRDGNQMLQSFLNFIVNVVVVLVVFHVFVVLAAAVVCGGSVFAIVGHAVVGGSGSVGHAGRAGA